MSRKAVDGITKDAIQVWYFLNNFFMANQRRIIWVTTGPISV